MPGQGPHPRPGLPFPQGAHHGSLEDPGHRRGRGSLGTLSRSVAATGASAADGLLSQGQPATASSTEIGGLPGRQRRRRQRRHPLVQRVQRPAVAAGRPRRHRHDHPRWCWTGRPRTPATSPSRPPPTAAPGPPSTPPSTAPAAGRRSPSPAAAGTSGWTPPRAPPSGASRCGSSRCTAAAAATPPTTPTIPPGAVRVAEFLADCPFSHRLPDDPIVFPNLPGASHMHSFFGSTVTNALLDGQRPAQREQQLQPVDRQVVVLDARPSTTTTCRSSRPPASSTTWVRASATT